MSQLQLTSTNNLFTAKDIAEPLASVTDEESNEMRKYFFEHNFDVIGFREKDRVIGFINKDGENTPKPSTASVKRFDIHDLITPNTDLKDCLKYLEGRQHLFLMDKSQVIGIITRADRQKPAVRMMLFGTVTIFESQLASLINLKYPNNSWEKLIGPARFKNAKVHHDKLVEKNLDINLINCTQICDKTDIVLKDSELLTSLIGLSKTKARDFFNRTQDLRNDLAHGQSLQNWFENEDVIALVDQLNTITDKIESYLK